MKALLCLSTIIIAALFVASIYSIVLHTADMLDEAMFWSTRPMRGMWIQHIAAVILAPMTVAGIAYLRHINRNWFEEVAMTIVVGGTMLSFAPIAFSFLILSFYTPFLLLGTLTGLTLILCALLIWGTAALLLG